MRLLSILFFFLVGFFGYAQVTISGVISDENGLPLRDAHVHIANKTISTDTNGNYILTGIPKGKQKLYISFIGYHAIEETIEISTDLTINRQLKLDITKLEDITIQQLSNSKSESSNEQVLKSATIEKFSNQTLGEALKEVSGVSILKTGSTIVKPVINGLHSNRVPIINNNVRLEDQQWGTEHAPNFDINAAGKITVIKGASALQYGGDAIGGIVIIEPEIIKEDTLVGKTILNLASNGMGGSLSSSLQKGNRYGWSWNALGTFKYLGDRETPDYVLSNSGNREQNFSGGIRYAQEKYNFNAMYSFYNAQIGIIKASHIGNVTDLYNSINDQQPSEIEPFTYSINAPKQEVQHHLAKINYQRWLNENTSIDFQYAFQFNNRLEFDVRRSSANNDKAALDLQLTTHTFLTDYKTSIGNWRLKSGLNLGYQNNFANPETGVRPLIPSYEKLDAGLYGIAVYKFDNATSLESGIRYDFSTIEATKYYLKSRWTERGYDAEFSHFIVGEEGNQWLTKPSFDYHNITANIGFRKQFHHEMEWLVNVSLASRNPNPSELFSDGLHHSTGQVELGDLRLEKEQAYKFNTTFNKDWKSFRIQINPFINRISNFIFLQPIGFETTIRGAFPVWEFKQTEALLTGFDVNTKWTITNHFSHELGLAYVNGQNLSTDEYLIDMPPFVINNKIQYKKESWFNFVSELKSEVVFTQNQFPNYNFETNIVVNNELTPVLVDISSPPKGYHLLHFYSEMTFKINKRNSLTTSFSVQNIMNTTYRDYLNRQRFYADEMGRNVQIQLKFNY
ncbi:TonB-dependent receptor [Flavobacterium cucumis]|uniref:Iron complex outermembrane recepter protein n=1 Tax=Flavobacterium cucumis TaxID=416016 RepID=A0A1M7ZUY2_9FLAO|nr:TonB-dependent receptor [Flavobacterium cucumis]SHO72666.1 iron complex outermembrane recepter protein [Flavobacterium cucumis]